MSNALPIPRWSCFASFVSRTIPRVQRRKCQFGGGGSLPTAAHISKVEVVRDELLHEIGILAHLLDDLDGRGNDLDDRIKVQLDRGLKKPRSV